MQNHKTNITTTIIILTLVCIITIPFDGGAETDTITSKSSIKGPETITSPGNVFKLGFYSPDQNPTNRYLAISYVVSDKTVVWIANRDIPLTGGSTSGTVGLSGDGNIVLMNSQNETIWSTNVTSRNGSTTSAHLRDNGNLELCDDSTGIVIWDSFSHPSHVYLPGLGLIDSTKTGEKVLVSSWKSDSDPGVGIFTTGLQALKIPQLFVWKSGDPYLRSGPWNGLYFIGVMSMFRAISLGSMRLIEMPNNGVFNFSLSPQDKLIRAALTSSGTVEFLQWKDREKSWDTIWIYPENKCDTYGRCGRFGVCNARESPVCSCLRGFEPANKDEWDGGNWRHGCVRRRPLNCEDGFWRMRFMKVPDFAEAFPSKKIDECRAMCLSNCSCIAYAHEGTIGCMFWWESDGLIDTQQFSIPGVDLYIRLMKSELVIAGVLLELIFIAWCLVFKRKGKGLEDHKKLKKFISMPSNSTAELFFEGRTTLEELTFFTLKTLAKATSQFHEENRLGEGGFGHVYKGKLANGERIAVKRLSEASQQGTQEFMNEVVIISRLQHKNLVRLHGCCVEKEEKMLVYEYMPNKSLDICLFDPTHPSEMILDWKKRLDIILGIGRGLLYLHKDSRLRIIHRDLKPSNVLLDEEWNPKISDFGMARIFGDNQYQENTARIVGTRGYMAPEYAMEGKFSEKSDVYSFGVLMLEIISGQKNTRYYNHGLSSSLLGCAWKYWIEDDAMAFVDQNIWSTSCRDEVVRCIHVALLCVQEFDEDRPMIQTVLAMLDGEILGLPVPKQPLLAGEMGNNINNLEAGSSRCRLTGTELEGR